MREWSEAKRWLTSLILRHELFNHWHDSKEQGQDHGILEVCSTSYVDHNIKVAWKSDGGDGENSQCVDVGLASVLSPTQLNADLRES